MSQYRSSDTEMNTAVLLQTSAPVSFVQLDVSGAVEASTPATEISVMVTTNKRTRPFINKYYACKSGLSRFIIAPFKTILQELSV